MGQGLFGAKKPTYKGPQAFTDAFANMQQGQPNPLSQATMNQGPIDQMQMPQPMQRAEQPNQKPGFFDKGGASQYVFAGLQDFLQRRMNEQPTGVASLMQRQQGEQQAAAAAQQAQLQRAQELSDWRMKEDYKNANPNPTSFQQDYDYILQNFGEEAAEKYRNNKIDPPVWRPGPDGQFYRVDTGSAQSGKPTPGVVEDGYRFKGGDPKDQNNWEQVAGGPTQPASGGF